FSWFCFPSILGVLILLYILYIIFLNIEIDNKSFISVFVQNAYIFGIGLFVVILFFGGYISPLNFYIADLFQHNTSLYSIILSFEQIFWIIFKTFCLFLIIIFIKKQNLFDLEQKNQIDIFWKYIIPLSITNIVIVCIIINQIGDFYVL
ncbi:NADH-quinone oxidoreductase subunit H, partial [bacterium]|nr:NADH-quinone oxidoreductase subunit H [bacterium]